MNADVIPEPELEFGGDGRHVDIRFGLMNYGPLDAGLATSPTAIRLGFVGTAESIERLAAWLDRCRDGIAAKPSKQPNLFPRFPGFGPDQLLHADIVTDASLHRTLREKDLTRICADEDDNAVVREAADLFLDELRGLTDKGSPVRPLLLSPRSG